MFSQKSTQCPKWKKIPSFMFPMFFLVLMFLPYAFTGSCLGLNMSVSVVPTGNIFQLYGTPLDLYCISDFNTSKLMFSVGDRILNYTVINSTAIRLYMKTPERQINTIYCQDKQRSVGCPTRVVIDIPPQSISNFSCISEDFEILNCTWTAPRAFLNLNYTCSFEEQSVRVIPINATIISEEENIWSCVWSTRGTPQYRQVFENYKFNIIGCNRFGCKEDTEFLDHFSVVKPGPPVKLNATEIGPHHAILKWNITPNIRDFLECGVDFKVEYQINKINNTSQFRSVDASSLSRKPLGPSYQFKLSGLPYAHMTYEVRVYVKSKKSTDLWSKYSHKVFTTTDEKPARAPDTVAGAFDQETYQDNRVIYVYWKQLAEEEEAGANFNYKVVTTHKNKQISLYPKTSLSYVIIEEASLDPFEVFIWSTNAVGSSNNYSSLYIPSDTKRRSLLLKSFTQVANTNGTYELSWEGLNNIHNYSLFWCEHINRRVCSGRMDFKVLDGSTTHCVIDLPSGNRYQFALSANNGTATTGMVWASCDIAKEGLKLYHFPVGLEHHEFGKTFVNLSWSLNCALKERIITGYKITYCPIIGASTYCDTSVGNKSIYIVDPDQLSVNITGLLPSRTYQFKIALNTTTGLKSIENTTHIVTTLEDRPTKPRNIRITDIKNDSLTVSWDPPLYKNGNIQEYVLYNLSGINNTDHKLLYNYAATDTSRRSMKIIKLMPFTNYTFIVEACNNALQLCSHSDDILVRTAIGPPSKLQNPTIKNSPDALIWSPPVIPGGIVDLYQIWKQTDDENEIFNTTETTFSLIHCTKAKSVTSYQVRAINYDSHPNYGVQSFNGNVILPMRENGSFKEYPGEWSDKAVIKCDHGEGLTLVYIIVSIFFIVGMGYSVFKLYKKCRKMEDIKPKLPVGLGMPEKDISKYAFISSKDEKAQSDEILLLPNNKTISSSVSQKDQHKCTDSDRTDSTSLSDTSKQSCPVVRIPSSPDNESESSNNTEQDINKIDNTIKVVEGKSPTSATCSSPGNSSYFNDKYFNKNKTTGYVETVANPDKSVASIPQRLLNDKSQVNSYVMAGLNLDDNTCRVPSPTIIDSIPSSSGYARPEDIRPKTNFNLPNLRPLPISLLSDKNSAKLSPLPPANKQEIDSYIQLQSLNANANNSVKPFVRNMLPSIQPTVSNGYVSSGDAVITKHLNNIKSAGQHTEESAVLDPTISPDAYCRFSWSDHPTTDNLHSLLNDTRVDSKNKMPL